MAERATMSATTARITPTDEAAIARAGDALGRAFFDDPLWSWVLPDDDRRRRVLGPFMTIGVRYGCAYGRVDATAPVVDGSAVWLVPGDTDFDPERGMPLGLADAPRLLGTEAFERFGLVMAHMGGLHHQHAPEEHWYLMILGVDPARQRMGLGGTMLQPVLRETDRDGRRCYLETQKAANVPFYRAHGFAVVEETDVPGGGPHLWLMARPARSR
jgi:ribosomal protein S18 acetylase RimI-like enzyme